MSKKLIVLEKVGPAPQGANLKAGHAAELRMAFYLRRAFAEAQDVFVFNDLLIERLGERAQIDHLVLHRYGFSIVESKSISESIHVNKHFEFSRSVAGESVGMRSPIEQARLQSQLLQSLLVDAAQELRTKKVFGLIQPTFDAQRFTIFVAISDEGIIEREIEVQQLLKAERVVGELSQLIERYGQTKGIGGFVKYMTTLDRSKAKELEDHHLGPFSDEEMKGLVEFILRANIEDRRVESAAEKCPLCASPMHIKTARKGNNAGSQFLSCSNYPRCVGKANLI